MSLLTSIGIIIAALLGARIILSAWSIRQKRCLPRIGTLEQSRDLQRKRIEELQREMAELRQLVDLHHKAIQRGFHKRNEEGCA